MATVGVKGLITNWVTATIYAVISKTVACVGATIIMLIFLLCLLKTIFILIMFIVLSRVSPVFVYFALYFPYHVYSPCIYEYFHFAFCKYF